MKIMYGNKVIMTEDTPIRIFIDGFSTTFGYVILNGTEYSLFASKQGKMVAGKPPESNKPS